MNSFVYYAHDHGRVSGRPSRTAYGCAYLRTWLQFRVVVHVLPGALLMQSARAQYQAALAKSMANGGTGVRPRQCCANFRGLLMKRSLVAAGARRVAPGRVTRYTVRERARPCALGCSFCVGSGRDCFPPVEQSRRRSLASLFALWSACTELVLINGIEWR